MRQRCKKTKRWLSVFMVITIVLTATGILTPVTKVEAGGYDYTKAVAYAKQWGNHNRNPEYRD